MMYNVGLEVKIDLVHKNPRYAMLQSPDSRIAIFR